MHLREGFIQNVLFKLPLNFCWGFMELVQRQNKEGSFVNEF